MANLDNATGFKPLRLKSGAAAPKPERYFLTDSTAVFVGDAVKLAGGADIFGVPTIAQAAQGDKPVGVVVGFDEVQGVTDANFSLSRTHRPASVDMYAFVVDDPDCIFEIQADDDTNTLAAVDIGLNADMIVAAGSTVTGLSGMELDSSTKATTSTLILRIHRIVQRPSNAAFVAQQKVEVMFNIHAYKTGYDTGATQEIGGLGV